MLFSSGPTPFSSLALPPSPQRGSFKSFHWISSGIVWLTSTFLDGLQNMLSKRSISSKTHHDMIDSLLLRFGPQLDLPVNLFLNLLHGQVLTIPACPVPVLLNTLPNHRLGSEDDLPATVLGQLS